MAGLTSDGFEAKTLEQIKAEIQDDIRADVDPGFDLSTQSPWGQLVGIFSSKLRECWEVMRELYSARDRNNATGQSLDNVGALTGTPRNEATFSRVLCTINIDPGTYAVGDLVAHVDGDPAARFVLNQEVINSGGSAANAEDVEFIAETAGAVLANAGTLTVIAEPFTGWNSVTNPADAEVGEEAEEDSDYKLRQVDELSAAGGSTYEAVRADFLKLLDDNGFEGECLVLFNDTDATDGDGLPPHSFEVVIYDGSTGGTNLTAAQLAEQVWLSKPVGIKSHGVTTTVHTDSTGIGRSLKYTRPTVKDVYLEFDIKVDPDVWQGAASLSLAETEVVGYGDDNLVNGRDVILRRLEAVLLTSVPGVWDVTETRAGFSASPVGTVNLVIAVREIASLDTSRILINVTEEVPS